MIQGFTSERKDKKKNLPDFTTKLGMSNKNKNLAGFNTNIERLNKNKNQYE
jgi:hypothetical protein